MFPREMVILMAIAAARTFQAQANVTADTSVTYVGHLYHSLVRRGYLTADPSGAYRLTPKGKVAVQELLQRNENRGEDLVATLQRLRIEVDEETGQLRA